MAKRKTTSSDPQPEKEKLELEKLQLELEGLRHPTRTSLRSFNWKDIVAIVVAVAAVLIGIFTGLFNVRNERLRIERMQLQQENKELDATRGTLQQEQANLQEELRRTKEQLGLQDEEWAAVKRIIRGIENQWIETRVELAGEGDQFGVTISRVSVPIAVSERSSKWSAGDNESEVEAEPRVSEILDNLQRVYRLASLEVENVQLSEADIGRIAKLGIGRLNLYNNRLSDETVEPLANMPKLAHLSFKGNKGIRHPKCLANLTALTFLSLGKTSFDDEGMTLLRPLSNSLRWLILSSTEVSDDGLLHLSDFTALHYLNLDSCVNVKGPGLIEVASLPNMESLSLNFCGIETGEHIELHELLRQRNPSLVIHGP